MHYFLVTEYSLGKLWENNVCVERMNQLPPFQFYPGRNSHVGVSKWMNIAIRRRARSVT